MPRKTPAALILGGLIALVLAGCGGGSSAEETVPPDDVVAVASPQLDQPSIELQTSVSTTHYAVTGWTTEQIFASIEENGPTDNLGRKGSGLTSVDWEYKWSGDRASGGACSIRALTISAGIRIELPEHAEEDELPDGLRANWRAYADGVAAHEQRHVDIYLEGAQDIKASMETIGVQETCSKLEGKIDAIWTDEQARINALQEAFHVEEDTRLAASRGPLEEQIESNRVRLAGLQSRIFSLDQTVNRLRAEVAVFDTEVGRINDEIKLINEQFPNELPDTVRQRLEQLIEQSNNLLGVYNQRVDEHNSAIFERNGLSDEYEALLSETNRMVDEYNWTR